MAISFTSFLLILKTTSLCSMEVELYIWTIACFAPFKASKVFFIKCGLAWVSTCTSTSSGIISSSINLLKKSYSIFDAEGNPTSISLKPSFTNNLKNSTFSSTVIGFINAWFPSLKSTLHHIGALLMVLFGHFLSFNSIVSNLLYFL